MGIAFRIIALIVFVAFLLNIFAYELALASDSTLAAASNLDKKNMVGSKRKFGRCVRGIAEGLQKPTAEAPHEKAEQEFYTETLGTVSSGSLYGLPYGTAANSGAPRGGSSRGEIRIFTGENMRMRKNPEKWNWYRDGGYLAEIAGHEFPETSFTKYPHMVVENVLVNEKGECWLGKTKVVWDRPDLAGTYVSVELGGKDAFCAFDAEGNMITERAIYEGEDMTMKQDPKSGRYYRDGGIPIRTVRRRMWDSWQFYRVHPRTIMERCPIGSKGLYRRRVKKYLRRPDLAGEHLTVQAYGDTLVFYHEDGRMISENVYYIGDEKEMRMVQDEETGKCVREGGMLCGVVTTGKSRPEKQNPQQRLIVERKYVNKNGNAWMGRRCVVRGRTDLAKTYVTLVEGEKEGDFVIYDEERNLASENVIYTGRKMHMAEDGTTDEWKRKGGEIAEIVGSSKLTREYYDKYPDMIVERVRVYKGDSTGGRINMMHDLRKRFPELAGRFLTVEVAEGRIRRIFSEEGKCIYFSQDNEERLNEIIQTLAGGIFERAVLRALRSVYGEAVVHGKQVLVDEFTQEYRYPDFYHSESRLFADAKLGLSGEDMIDTVLKYVRLKRSMNWSEPLTIIAYDTVNRERVTRLLLGTREIGEEDFQIVDFDEFMEQISVQQETRRGLELRLNIAFEYEVAEDRAALRGMRDDLLEGAEERRFMGFALHNVEAWQRYLDNNYLENKPASILIRALEKTAANHSPCWERSYHLKLLAFLSYVQDRLDGTPQFNQSDNETITQLIMHIYGRIPPGLWKDIVEHEQLLASSQRVPSRRKEVQEAIPEEAKPKREESLSAGPFSLGTFLEELPGRTRRLAQAAGKASVEMGPVSAPPKAVELIKSGQPEVKLFEILKDDIDCPYRCFSDVRKYASPNQGEISRWSATKRTRLASFIVYIFYYYFTHVDRYEDYRELAGLKARGQLPTKSDFLSVLDRMATRHTEGKDKVQFPGGKSITFARLRKELTNVIEMIEGKATGGTMGRWKYERITLEPDGRLILHDATRILKEDVEGNDIPEPEFGTEPRDIVLKTRKRYAAENTKIAGIEERLGITLGATRVIERDETAIFHRIYGAAAATDGIPFVREDIIAKGSEVQIKEAIDHEYKHIQYPDMSHDDIRKTKQFRGEPGEDLRALITILNARDKADAGTRGLPGIGRLTGGKPGGGLRKPGPANRAI
jgi:hypothetical protein